MKSIGRTNEGKYLVELTPDENQTLCNLADALGGGSGFNPMMDRMGRDIDLSNAFNAIQSYAIHLGVVNQLKELTNQLQEALTGRKEQESNR